MKKIKKLLAFIRTIHLRNYIYLNYFSKNVSRNGKGKVIPYKNAVIDLKKGSKIIIYDRPLEIATNKLRGSKAETYIRLGKNAVWNAKGGCNLAYGTTIEVLESAKLDAGFFSMNSFSTMVVANHVTIGDDVMIARNVTILDSDFHEIMYKERKYNRNEKIEIGDHVWIAANSTVVKNVRLGDGSIISADTLVITDSGKQTLVGNEVKQIILRENVEWKR
ncbi:hypothetical protein AALH30_18365 [Blautia pseudococcoides]|uniref:acyltransferase n=1 Tax=Blautia pseudococcoides TaxID=1796616 RepID=UPI00148AE445|nr:hypothetical protein [Blautia pseudococcoides]QJU16519.1 hypothetical protein HL650_20060 [Blautia pseudococcoides]